MFKGSNVALVTPFKNDKLDEETYIKLIHFHIENGTNGLVPAGTTGESPTLSHDEHEKVIELCVKESKGKLPVFAGTGSNSTEEAISLTKHAEKIGANGALVVTPYYNKPTQEGLYLHFKKIADSVPVPLIPYNVPGRTSCDMLPSTVKKFLENGDKVKITLRFRGREMVHQELGSNVLDRVKDETDAFSKIEALPKLEGRQMVMVLAPK